MSPAWQADSQALETDKPGGSSLCHPPTAGSVAGELWPTLAFPPPGNCPRHWSPLVATRTEDTAPLDRSGDEVVFPQDHSQGPSPHCSTLARPVGVIRGGVTPRGGPCSGGAVGRPQGRRGSPVSSPRPWRGRGVLGRTPEHALLLPDPGGPCCLRPRAQLPWVRGDRGLMGRH